MGRIIPENNLKFRKSTELFSRITSFLNTYDQQGLIDEGDFHDYVIFVLEQLGVAVYVQHQSLIKVKDHVGKLPCNFKVWEAAYKCHPLQHNIKSINEQRPWIYYMDNEITKECPNDCSIECRGEEQGKTKVVIRTFVNGDTDEYHYGDLRELVLSPNVQRPHSKDCERIIPSKMNEVTIDDNELICHFKEDSVFMKYYGLPIDDNYLPMIPDNPDIEAAIEYYIYKRLFEQWYLNSTVPDAVNKLKYVIDQYDYHLRQARYWAKLPSFQRMVQAIRRQRNTLNIYQMQDRTRVGNWGFGRWRY